MAIAFVLDTATADVAFVMLSGPATVPRAQACLYRLQQETLPGRLLVDVRGFVAIPRTDVVESFVTIYTDALRATCAGRQVALVVQPGSHVAVATAVITSLGLGEWVRVFTHLPDAAAWLHVDVYRLCGKSEASARA